MSRGLRRCPPQAARAPSERSGVGGGAGRARGVRGDCVEESAERAAREMWERICYCRYCWTLELALRRRGQGVGRTHVNGEVVCQGCFGVLYRFPYLPIIFITIKRNFRRISS